VQQKNLESGGPKGDSRRYHVAEPLLKSAAVWPNTGETGLQKGTGGPSKLDLQPNKKKKKNKTL